MVQASLVTDSNKLTTPMLENKLSDAPFDKFHYLYPL